MNTGPEVDLASGGKKTEPPRIKRMIADGIDLPIPPNPAPYITEWLFEVGPTMPTGMGAAHLSWSEIGEWARQTGLELTPWEATTLRDLSVEFLAMTNKARKPSCLAPWQSGDAATANRKAVSDQFARMMKVAQLSQQHSNAAKATSKKVK